MNLSYEIRSDLSRIEWDKVHAWLASSYWSPGISLERVQRGARNSALVLGAYTRPALSSPATQVAQKRKTTVRYRRTGGSPRPMRTVFTPASGLSP